MSLRTLAVNKILRFILLPMSLKQQEASAYKYSQDHRAAHAFLPLDSYFSKP
jgi:hypothetical protein